MAIYTKKEISDKVKEIVHDQLGTSMESIVDSANYANDLGADSLDCVEIVIALEEEFAIPIPEEDAENLDTISKTIDYLCKVLGAEDNA